MNQWVTAIVAQALVPHAAEVVGQLVRTVQGGFAILLEPTLGLRPNTGLTSAPSEIAEAHETATSLAEMLRMFHERLAALLGENRLAIAGSVEVTLSDDGRLVFAQPSAEWQAIEPQVANDPLLLAAYRRIDAIVSGRLSDSYGRSMPEIGTAPWSWSGTRSLRLRWTPAGVVVLA